MSDNLLMRFPAVLPCSKSNVSGFKIRKQVTDDQGAHILQIIWGVGSLHWRGVGGGGMAPLSRAQTPAAPILRDFIYVPPLTPWLPDFL